MIVNNMEISSNKDYQELIYHLLRSLARIKSTYGYMDIRMESESEALKISKDMFQSDKDNILDYIEITRTNVRIYRRRPNAITEKKIVLFQC